MEGGLRTDFGRCSGYCIDPTGMTVMVLRTATTVAMMHSIGQLLSAAISGVVTIGLSIRGVEPVTPTMLRLWV